MPLSADSVLDRIKLKGQIRWWRSLAIVAFMVAAFLAVNKPFGEKIGLADGMIARITVEDVIFENKERDKILDNIKNNDAIKAVLVYINSPGGTVVGGENLYTSLREIATKKPVVAVLQSVAASGGYMAALGTDYIVAHRGTITGSIGVILQTAEITELAHKLGVNLLTFKSGPLKAVPSPFEKLTPEARESIQASVEDTYKFFVDMVAERRKLPRSVVVKLADGRVYTGGQAFEHKLVDALGGEKIALKWLYAQKNIATSLEIKNITLKEENSIVENWLSSFSFMGKKVFTSHPVAQGGLFALWSPNN